jgi:hypothetical protein
MFILGVGIIIRDFVTTIRDNTANVVVVRTRITLIGGAVGGTLLARRRRIPILLLPDNCRVPRIARIDR